jgi:hypothetical protein
MASLSSRLVFLLFILNPTTANTCVQSNEIKKHVCWALCRKDTADTGYYDQKSKSCVCGFKKKYEEATNQTLKVTPPERW